MSEVTKHGTHDQQSHAGGRGGRGGGAGGGSRGGAMSGATNAKGEPLSRKDDNKLNDLSIDLFNHKQGVPLTVRTGKLNTPSAKTWMEGGKKIIDQAQNIYGGTFGEAERELNRRMGL